MRPGTRPASPTLNRAGPAARPIRVLDDLDRAAAHLSLDRLAECGPEHPDHPVAPRLCRADPRDPADRRPRADGQERLRLSAEAAGVTGAQDDGDPGPPTRFFWIVLAPLFSRLVLRRDLTHS